MRLLRIVPDDTRFDFMRFRRISFPISAALSIAAILLYFFHGLNFGIDFVGGTLMEVQTKNGPADLASMRATIGALNLGEVQLQQFGAPNDVLIRLSEQPGGDAAQQVAVQKVRKALGDAVEYRRVEVVGPSVSTADSASGTVIRPSSNARPAAGTAATASGRPLGRAMENPRTASNSTMPIVLASTGAIQ